MGKNRNRDNLGKEAEDAVESAVKELIEEDSKLPENNRRFVGYIRAQCSDILDSYGIDNLVFLNSGAAIPIQIKAVKKRKRRVFNKFHRDHPAIKFVLFIRKKPLWDPAAPSYRRTLDYIKRKIVNYADRCTKISGNPDKNPQP